MTLSIWHILVLLIVLGGTLSVIVGLGRIIRRTGASLWWLLPMLIPYLGLYFVLWFSYAKWPNMDRR